MPKRPFAQMHCSLARALDDVGDPWTPLVLRDVYLGVDTFEQLVRNLDISRALLSARLDALVRRGVLERVEYRARPQRFRYQLTAAGLDLMPVLIALTQWGDRWIAPDGPPITFRHGCGEALHTEITCRSCRERVAPDAVTPAPGPGARIGPGTRVIAELLTTTEEPA